MDDTIYQILLSLIAIAELAGIGKCILDIFYAISEYRKAQNQPSPQGRIKQLYTSNKLVVKEAKLVAYGKTTTTAERDYLHDSVIRSSGGVTPDPIYGVTSNKKAYKYTTREQQMSSQYKVEDKGLSYVATLKNETTPRITVYCNTDCMWEMYSSREVEKALSWDDKKERTYRKMLVDGVRETVFIRCGIIIALIAHFVYSWNNA